MSTFRLLADDLTGALDSAARFVPRFGPIPVHWRTPTDAPCAAYDSATREITDPGPAMRRWAPELGAADLAFKKLDSLLRGHVAAEIAACLRLGPFAHAIIAPAFPFQGRITSGGRQFAHGTDVGVDLDLAFARLGIPLSHCRPTDAASPGVSLWDAIDEADLDQIALAGRGLDGPVLWCGTGGLAAALAARQPPLPPAIELPILALIGSDHPATSAQFAAIPTRATVTGPAEARALARLIAGESAAIRVHVPPDTARPAAAAHIAATFSAILAALATTTARPGTLLVTGGETLRGLCDALGADHLVVTGEREPGIPVARMAGGLWDGLTVIAKSGAFGKPDFLARLLAN